ncbi:Ig domain-containing protein [Terriglobus aquaticus]|uniref:Ig domain-containing protein n=1 Tax=Terriglobus aquaticus TaxID=940139 RepID=A0ABW9KHW8_9BACT|nr:Ig domain-containing protein [Terriglobus aquaticus]
MFGASAVLLLAVLQGCGAGMPNVVEAAEQTASSTALTVQTPNTVPGVQLGSGSITVTAMAGQSFAFPMQVIGGKSPYQWSVISGSLPTGISLTSSGNVSGTLAAPGTWTATIQVSDSAKPPKVQQEIVTFKVAPRALAVTTTSVPGGQVNSAYNAPLKADGGTPNFTWSLESGSLPTGLSVSPSGAIIGTPTKAMTTTFSVAVSDSGSPAQRKSQSMTLAVTEAPIVVTSTSLGNAQQNSAFSATLHATGGDGTFAWSLNSGSLPAGLVLNSNGTITGTPTSSGPSNFSVAVRDAAQRTTANLSLVVAPAPPPLTVTTSSLSSATNGNAYNAALAATGGTPSYTWSLGSGSLPAGVTLSSSGVLSGTPTVSGNFTFTAAVADQSSPALHTSKAFTLAVANTPLTINTGSFTAAQNNVSYAAQLSATGGTQGYTWSIKSGSLPAGLTLQATTGAITGTPSSNGSYTFTYQVADSGSPQQTASASATITVGAAPAALTAGTTWFVRPDGGNRYDASLYTLGQCDGKADAPYPGHGYNQHCAFSDLRYMWMVGTYGNAGWVMQGGDTLVIEGCNALPSQQNPDGTHCRIGWDKATGNDSQNFWGAGVSAWWGLSMPPPPSGTATQHTRILGACAYGNYSCNPVNTYPYTNNNLTQIYASFGSNIAIFLTGSQYVDLEGLEITTHNGTCARYGTTNPLPGCNTGANRPLSDQADQAIATDNTSANILLQDIYIHGFSSNGIGGPIGGKIVANRVNISFNAFAGWNFDDGHSTNNAPGSSLEQHYVTMVGNGCQEEYPIVHTQFPAKGCWDTTSGGFGDSWSGQQGGMDSFSCDHCYIAYNSKDGAMGPHTLIGNLSLTNSAWIGNMGQSGKWGQGSNATFLFQNNVVIGNCMRMSQYLPGAAQNFDSRTGLTGSGLSGYCRAAGPLIDYFSGANSTVQFDHNTVVTYQPTIFEPGCLNPGTCGTSPINFTNNIVLAYTSSYGISPFNPGQQPGLFYKDDSSVPIQSSHNIWYGIKNDYSTCGNNGTLCTDPMLAGELPQGGFTTVESALDNFNFRPAPGSPAIAQGVMNALTPLLDFFGVQQTATPTIGAAVQ